MSSATLEAERTRGVIRSELERMQIPYVDVDEGGIVATLGNGKEGKRIALRADMDALPITEDTDPPFKSKNVGVMHACGHDGHTAILLGTARMLKAVESELPGQAYLCFQAAEEIGRGARPIIDYLKAQGGVDRVIAEHLWADIDAGKISIIAGARMAGGDSFTIEIEGSGGHGSRPDQCQDPIKAAATILLNAIAIPTNRISPFEHTVVHIGKLEAGTVANAFPSRAALHGGFRTFSREGRDRVLELLREIAEHGAAMWGTKATLTHHGGVPPVINDADAVALAHQVVHKLGTFELDAFEPLTASENYGEFVEAFPGFMAYVGIRNPGKRLTYAQHHARFGVDEAVLAPTAEFFAQYVFDYLNDATP